MLSNCGAGEDSWESLGQEGDQSNQSKRMSTLNIHWKHWKLLHWKQLQHWCWSLSSRLCSPDAKSQLFRKDPDAGKDWRQEKGTTEDKVVGWHHWFNGHELEKTPGDDERQEVLLCCSPWGHKELDMTEWLNNNMPSQFVRDHLSKRKFLSNFSYRYALIRILSDIQ